jgi:hypothetical protein
VNPILLCEGYSEPDVRVLQEKLNLKPDGIFGPKTKAEVVERCEAHNRKAQFQSERVRTDGTVDGWVWAALGLSAYARRAPVPPRANDNQVRPARQSTMLNTFGEPRSELSVHCSTVTNNALLSRMVFNENLVRFKVNGLKPAVDSLRCVLNDVLIEEPELYVRLSSAGMLCVRAVRGSTKNWSNHSWGTAIDVKIDNMLDPYGDGNCQFGLLCAARLFNRHGWYWGAEFSREDAMHFEAGEELVRSWA